MPALDGERLTRAAMRLADERVLAPPVVDVVRRVDGEHQQGRRRRLLPYREGPEERYAVQEPEEERRVAERREGAADVRHEEGEEDDRVRPMAARAIGAQQRPDDEHRCPRRTDPRREHRPDRDQHAVGRRRPAQRSADVDAATDGEERRDQDDERDVVDDRHMGELVDGRHAVAEHERPRQHHRPGRRDLRVMMVPENGREQREQRDR